MSFIRKKFPFTISAYGDETRKKLVKAPKEFVDEMVRIGPNEISMPKSYQKHAEELYNFEVRPDDVWISTFARAGTTWTKEMIWLICNDLDYEKAKTKPQMLRFPFLE